MAVELSSFFILTLIPLVSLVLLKLLVISRRSENNKPTSFKLPPGPWKLPLVGNMHQLVLGSPRQGLRDLSREYGPLMHIKLGQVSSVVVSSAETAEQILKIHDPSFASRPQTIASKAVLYDNTGIIFTPYGESWRQHRKICVVELLSARRVQSFRKMREEEFSSLVRWIASKAGSSINLTQKSTSTTFTVISRATFGKKTEEQEAFISAIKEVSKLMEGFSVAELYPSVKFLQYISGMKLKLDRVKLRIDIILEKIIQEHRSRKSHAVREKEETYEDLVDVLLKFQGDKTELFLTTESIKAILMDMFSAGGETSATTLDWLMSEILKNPSVLKKAQAEVRQVFDKTGCVVEESLHELKYLKAVVKETLRLHPPFPLILRECREACEINGYEIPEKTQVLLNVFAIGTDPSYWEDPESFKPERFLDSSIDYNGANFEYIPFGAGRRMCPGMALGLVNVELPLAMILYHFDFYLPDGMRSEEVDMTTKPGLSMGRKHDLYVVPVVYKP